MDGVFSPNVEAAVRVALAAHDGQTRKGDDTPYISHPVHVALILARAGADEVTLQAALLHDVVEDCDGWELTDIEDRFGGEVARVVDAVTDIAGDSWEDRKAAQVEHVPSMDARALAVKIADKLHNMHSLRDRVREAPTNDEAWSVFSRGPEQTLEHAAALTVAFGQRLASEPSWQPILEPLVRELHEVIGDLRSSL